MHALRFSVSFASAFVLASAFLGGCSAESQPDSKVAEVKSDLPRDTAPNVAAQEQTALAQGNGDFAFDLHRWIAKRSDSAGRNLFYSPHSISTALAMTYAGARGATEAEMAKALHFDLAQDRLHPAFNWLDLELAARAKQAPPEGGDARPFRLRVANSLWGQQGKSFEKPFLDTLARNYGAGVKVVDFKEQNEATRQLINGWVADTTEKKIENLIPDGSLPSDSRLVLVNAIYFSASWASFFEPNTAAASFTKADGTTVQVPTMKQTHVFPYVDGETYEALEMPYAGNKVSFVVIAPKAGQLAAFESELSRGAWASAVSALKPTNLALAFPKFKIAPPTVNLGEALADLGMPTAFGDKADFSGMTKEEALQIRKVLHKAFIDVDEKGTEAAAATAVIMGPTSVPATPKTVKIDRPFFFAIRDVPTGAILFAGRVVDPSL